MRVMRCRVGLDPDDPAPSEDPDPEPWYGHETGGQVDNRERVRV